MFTFHCDIMFISEAVLTTYVLYSKIGIYLFIHYARCCFAQRSIVFQLFVSFMKYKISCVKKSTNEAMPWLLHLLYIYWYIGDTNYWHRVCFKWEMHMLNNVQKARCSERISKLNSHDDHKINLFILQNTRAATRITKSFLIFTSKEMRWKIDVKSVVICRVLSKLVFTPSQYKICSHLQH